MNEAQWQHVVEGIRNGDPRTMAFRQLDDDSKSLTDFLCRKDGARVAVSYKHIPRKQGVVLGLQRRRHAATDRQMDLLRHLLKMEIVGLRKNCVSICFDHSKNKREGSYGWITCGALPYTTFKVCYLPGAEDIDSSPAGRGMGVD